MRRLTAPALLLSLLSACGLLGGAGPEASDDSRTPLEHVLNATVVVGHRPLPDGPHLLHCSGAVYQQVILTADHCTERGQQLWVRFRGEDPEAWTLARVIARDPEQDLAVLQTSRALPPGFEMSPRDVRYGDKIAIAGHPWGLLWTYDVGMVTFPRREGGGVTGVQIWTQHDADSDPGDSGGPVVDVMGRLVGITSFGIGRQEGAVHRSQILALLESLGYAPAKTLE